MIFVRSKHAVQQVPFLMHCRRDQDLAPGITYGPVIRDFYIFECCVSGYGSVIINDKEFAVQPGDFYVLFPGDRVMHTADTVNPRSGYSCSANGLALGPMLNNAGISSAQPFVPRQLFEMAKEQLELMYKLEFESDPGAEFRRTACFYHILGALFEQSQIVDKDEVIQKAISIMESRYGEELTTQELADAVGLERSYFSSFFKSKTGLPPHRYLTRLRIQKACLLIERSDISISLVAESVGLDPQNFSRIFKRELGVTPKEYRNK